jgi:ABC-type bacteriocin/lantibiotic exporter with double-glycine peptidase domain
MKYSYLLSTLFSFCVLFLIFSLFIYALPVLITLAVIFLVIISFIWFGLYVYSRVKQQIHQNKYDENGLRKTKASIVDIKPSEEKKD